MNETIQIALILHLRLVTRERGVFLYFPLSFYITLAESAEEELPVFLLLPKKGVGKKTACRL